MDRMTEMEAYTSVVEQGGFTGAARKLGISKSAVSKHIASLEQRLGTRLLERTTRRVSPTEIGMAYYDRAREILTSVVDAEQLVSEKTVAPSGILRVAVNDESAVRYLASRMPCFLHEHPELKVHLTRTDGQTEMNRDQFDILVSTGQMDGIPSSRLLAEYQMRLVAAPEYVARSGQPTRIDDLADHQILDCVGGNGNATFTLTSRSGERRVVHAPGRLTFRDTDVVLQAVEQGLGIGLFPDFAIAPALAAGRLVEILSDLPPQMAAIQATYSPGDAASPKIRAFISHFTLEDSQIDELRRAGAA